MSSLLKILRVRVPAQGFGTEPADWLALDASGRVVGQGRARLENLPHDAELELVLPARRVALHRLEMPEVASRHEAAVIRQQLEDRLLGTMADSHFVRGTRNGSQQAVWLVSRAWMLDLLETCRAANRAPTRAVPEQALLPAQSFAATADGFVYRTSQGACGILPEQALLEPVCGESLTQIESLLAAQAAPLPDLLQGLPSLQQNQRISRPLLKLAGVLLLALAASHLLSQLLVWRQLASQEKTLRESIRQNFAAAHPGLPLVDPVLQWRQLHSRHTAKDGDALDQLAQFAAQTNVAIRPQRIDADANTLKLTVSTSDAAQLKPALQGQNIPFESQTTDKGLEQLSLTRRDQGSRP